MRIKIRCEVERVIYGVFNLISSWVLVIIAVASYPFLSQTVTLATHAHCICILWVGGTRRLVFLFEKLVDFIFQSKFCNSELCHSVHIRQHYGIKVVLCTTEVPGRAAVGVEETRQLHASNNRKTTSSESFITHLACGALKVESSVNKYKEEKVFLC